MEGFVADFVVVIQVCVDKLLGATVEIQLNWAVKNEP